MCLNCGFEHLYWYPSRNLLSTVYLNSRWEFCSLFALKLQNSWYKKFIRLPADVSGRLWHNATGAGCTTRKEGMKANRCEEGTDAMVTRPQHVPWLSYETHLCHFICQHCIGYLNGISMPHPSFSAQFRGQITIQSKSHVILISWISSGKNATVHFTYHTLQLFLNEPHAYLLQD